MLRHLNKPRRVWCHHNCWLTTTQRCPSRWLQTLQRMEWEQSYHMFTQQLGHATRNDPILSKVWQYIWSGCPEEVRESLKPYWSRRHKLTIEGSCVMWGIRVVVPKKLQIQVLEELHREHPGIVCEDEVHSKELHVVAWN